MPDQVEQKLLEAAGQVFAEKGFKAATVREIIAQAGIKNIAAVNYYFGDKEKLYDATLRYAFHCRLDQMPIPHWSAGTAPSVKLRDFIHAIVAHMLQKQHPWQMKLLLRELGDPSATGAGLVRDFIQPIYGALFGILRELLGPEVPETELHLTGFSIVGQIFYQRVAGPVISLVVGKEEHAAYDVQRLAEHIVQFSLAALGATLPRAKKGARV